MMPAGIRDKHIAVTGAAGALGSALVARLSGAGARVIGIDYAAEAPGSAAYIFIGSVDLRDERSASSAFARISDLCPRIDGLVNVAGGFRWETVSDGSVQSWDLLYRMNVLTALNATRAALPLLRVQGGSIVNIGAAAALKSAAGMGAYAASKAGVARLTESLADEEKDRGIRVNAVLPSILDTPTNRADMPEAEHGRWVTPDALASVILFLLSDDAAAITGACIPVTGRV
jgi:NAD(P)-dependent dehydrogenase (short-subunit alcohol dehydrogenase family)